MKNALGILVFLLLCICLVGCSSIATARQRDVYSLSKNEKRPTPQVAFSSIALLSQSDFEQLLGNKSLQWSKLPSSTASPVNSSTAHQPPLVVRVTANGKKYHLPSCASVKQEQTSEIPYIEAVIRGYTPCKVCKP